MVLFNFFPFSFLYTEEFNEFAETLKMERQVSTQSGTNGDASELDEINSEGYPEGKSLSILFHV